MPTLFLLLLILFFLILVSIVAVAMIIAPFTTGVPFVPSNRKVVERMIDATTPKKGETVYDLGSGNGEMLFRVDPNCKRIGYERVRILHGWAKLRNVWKKGRVDFRRGDFFKVDLSDADVILCYLFPGLMERFEKEIWPKLPKGTRVASHAFALPNTKEKKMIREGKAKIWLYVK